MGSLRSYLPRLPELSFSGKVEDWPDFRRKWTARYGSVSKDVQVQYLKQSLPAKDKAKVTAIMDIDECWKILERTYGDRQLNIVTVKKALTGFVVKGKEPWEKILSLHGHVEVAIAQLEVLGAKSTLQEDFELVSMLVGKLATETKYDWNRF